MRTLQAVQARKSLLQSMLAQLRCGSTAVASHTWHGTAAGSSFESRLRSAGRGGERKIPPGNTHLADQ